MEKRGKSTTPAKLLEQLLAEARDVQRRSEETIRQMRELVSQIAEARATSEDARRRK